MANTRRAPATTSASLGLPHDPMTVDSNVRVLATTGISTNLTDVANPTNPASTKNLITTTGLQPNCEGPINKVLAASDPSMQAKLDQIRDMIKGLDGPKPSNLELDSSRGSLFSAYINALPLPKFKMLIWKMCTRKEDPLGHLKYFEIQTNLPQISRDVRCRIFQATLAEIAQQWYFKLVPGRFNSWEEFS
uniref:Retrotransposon gag domain-containing protein n=1 Tax=Cannabis sativa TaxID=3483 RepID=A0A803PSR4_CANSA